MNWRTRLIHSQRIIPQVFPSLAPPTHRGSTVVFDSMATVSDSWQQLEQGYSYGVHGTPTTLQLAARIAEIEGARHTFLTPGGQSAIALVYFSFCSAGCHVLLPRNAYGPNAVLAAGLLKRLGVHAERYDPAIGGDIAKLIQPNTSLIWCESPGSVTMEIQDVPAIVAAAHASNVPVALDNTYSAGVFFDAFAFGVDISVQALTKYVGGHSDLLLGSVSVNSEANYKQVGGTLRQLGMAVSPDECTLALRGLQTLAVRLDAVERSTLTVATWLAQRPELDSVRHPALPGCPGHALWQRDFTGSSSLFSILFTDRYTPQQVNRFVDTLQLFKIGWSWGGVTSLAMAYPAMNRLDPKYHGRIVRLNIGLEDPADLIDDLAKAFAALA